MVTVTVQVPEDRLVDLYRSLSEILEPRSEKPRAEPTPWTVALAREAATKMLDEERTLLLRLAEARGRRVPMSELAADLGLPPAPALEQDFPGLTRFCSTPKADGGSAPTTPILAGGADAEGWYWMSPDDANAFRRALKPAASVNAPASPAAANGQAG